MRSKSEEDTLTGAKRVVYFATGNKGKYEEAAEVAEGFGIQLKQLRFNKLEIQSNKLEEIASYAVRHAASATKRAVVAEDAGLFIDALQGFPGPYSSYVYGTLGCEGVLRLMDHTKRRTAHFQAVVAFCSPSKPVRCFSGIVNGIINRKAKGNEGFGFDPIFMPLHHSETFAELSVTKKNRFSHRSKAFTKFFHWFMRTQ